MAANGLRHPTCRLTGRKELLMPKTLAWLGGGSTVATAATFMHGPLLVVFLILVAVVIAAIAALVTTFVAAVFFTGPRRNLVALIKAWRWPRGAP